MESATENPSPTQMNGLDSPISPRISDHDLLSELESLRECHRSLQSRSSAMEENLVLLKHQRDEAVERSDELAKEIDQISRERDALRGQIDERELSAKEKEDESARRMSDEMSRKEEFNSELDASRGRTEQLEKELKEAKGKNDFLLECTESVQFVKHCLVKLIEGVDDDGNVFDGENNESFQPELDDLSAFWEQLEALKQLAGEAESQVKEYKEKRKKEKKELENSVVSLTEENRDINSLLRIALVEKEAVERKLKGNSEHKRVALLQIAERGLQRVGFGFMMGSGSNEQQMDSSWANTAENKSDSGESEEEAASLASTVEKIMKNLRLEITQLRRSLEESRSDTERLQSLVEKQGKDLADNTMYVKELEGRERVLAQNVEELLMEINESEAEVVRWREACELEVEAGKKEIGERDKLIDILKQELEKTKAALEISNGKLNLKEELAAAAMAAQAAAERSLQLADSRVAGLRTRIEELTRQSEEAENRERSRYKVRHMCWPWRFIKVNPSSNASYRIRNIRWMLPEMQSLVRNSG
ncbi:putative ATP binding protein [Tripterygium wilfordii]|uniref:Putative ATP binding protein n=1 Tax=Tripterygium wilfordii TaxID=458696 RepID=A0A7J7CBS5_TRIWF|nr:uncharacterized protein At3g49055 isoform X2 [Tripterygium wilfordii]KAF5731186.1 putative ATP binding protein [Tripterygium wilfordii]